MERDNLTEKRWLEGRLGIRKRMDEAGREKGFPVGTLLYADAV